MFQAHATLDRTANFSSGVTSDREEGNAPVTYMIFRDGRPFLMVNAAKKHVRVLVEGFAAQSDYHWSYEVQQAA